MISGCPCDRIDLVPLPDVPPGLDRLPLQLATFPAVRRRLLTRIVAHPVLSAWRGRDPTDLGLMLLEMKAYLEDISGFYESETLNDAFLRSAAARATINALVGLIGYRPAPATASVATLAVLADGHDPLRLPRGVAFRSAGFGGQPPQVFELLEPTDVHPARNTWKLAPVRRGGFDGTIRFAANAAGLVPGQIVVIQYGTSLWAGRVATSGTEAATDGTLYRIATFETAPPIPAGTALADIKVSIVTQSASPNPHGTATAGSSSGASYVVLEAVMPQLKACDIIVVESDGTLYPRTVASVTTTSVDVATDNSTPPKTVPFPATRITFFTVSGLDSTSTRVHFRLVPAGALTRPAELRVQPSDLDGGAALMQPVAPFDSAAAPATIAIKGAELEGAVVPGTVDHVTRRVVPAGPVPGPPLTAPLTIYGNLIEVVRGETVANEVLGSADATVAFQSFSLKQKPLTYVSDANDPDRVRPQLEVRVNGILWRRVRSFLEARPEEQVYVVRQNEAGESLVIFGETTRPPSGVNNVTASYRYGAGAAKPPAGAIAQLVRPVERLRSVFNPVASRGGSDAESPRDVRRAGPRAALTLGRAISLPDFEALARAYPGVVNATAAWAWDAGFQRAAVRVWVVSDGGSVAGDVAASLRAQSDPNVALSVTEASRVATSLIIDLEIDPRATADAVRSAVRAALIDPATGALALANVPIGRPIFRSYVLQKIMAVAGVLSVRSLVLDGAAAPAAFPGVEGEIRDFTNLTVG